MNPVDPFHLDQHSLYHLLPFSLLTPMAGPVIYEASQLHMMPNAHGQELMTDWSPAIGGSFGGNVRREKDSDNRAAAASPAYSHLSVADSNSHSSPYTHGQTMVINAPSPSYHIPYPTMSGTHLQPTSVQPSPRLSPLAQAATYYPTPSGDYEVYHTPSRGSFSTDRLSPLGEASGSVTQQASFDVMQGAPPLLTTSTLTRSYDSTIPSYYQVTDGRSAWSQAALDQGAAGQKRKREKTANKDSTPSGKSMKTPKRTKQQQQQEGGSGGGGSGGRAMKRVKTDEAARAQSQLPTPPSTGREISMPNLPPHLRVPMITEDVMTPIDEAPEFSDEQPSRRALVITRHQEEGRKLGLLGISQGDLETSTSSEEGRLSPRTTTIPALTTDATGLASLATNEVLESEVAWFENSVRAHSPPSSPDHVTIQTPTTSHANVGYDDDVDSPELKAAKTARRLKAFAEEMVYDEQPLVCTRIDLFGRVAVRKDTAVKFLGLDHDTRIVEEIKADDEDVWRERPIASSSRIVLKPIWPDEEAPWALAGGSRKQKIRREASEKATLLKRYLESTSDESSDEDPVIDMYTTHGKGKGKSITRLLSSSSSDTSDSRRRQLRGLSPTESEANARAALLISLRNRAVPMLPAGVVACHCGASSTNGMGSMISCAACKTWHHIMCCGIEDESKIGPNWWCSSCEAGSRSIHTPAHTTPRGAYSQLEPHSSAVKTDIGHIALAPSPMFMTNPGLSSSIGSTRTPLGRVMSSPQRPHRARMLSYGADMWAFTEDGSGGPPSTPAPIMNDRFSTPRIDDAPFDVTSTPSRHLDFNFGQPSLFSLTPLGGRSRVPSTLLIDGTPRRTFSGAGEALSMSVPSRADFFRELNKGSVSVSASGGPGSAGVGVGVGPGIESLPPVSPRWPSHGLLGAHNLSPSPFGHKRSLSSGTSKMSSIRSSSRSGLGNGHPHLHPHPHNQGLGMSLQEDKSEDVKQM